LVEAILSECLLLYCCKYELVLRFKCLKQPHHSLINPSLSGYQKANATVSIVHSQTKNPEEITRQADIVIAAVGVANLVRGNWIKPGAAIIDVGINPVDVSNLVLIFPC
jgi:hypothetical protein